MSAVRDGRAARAWLQVVLFGFCFVSVEAVLQDRRLDAQGNSSAYGPPAKNGKKSPARTRSSGGHWVSLADEDFNEQKLRRQKGKSDDLGPTLEFHPAVSNEAAEAELRTAHAAVPSRLGTTQSLRRASDLETPVHHCDFTQATMVHSNLGDKGPDTGEPTMVLRRIASIGDSLVNLVAEVESNYVPLSTRDNRMNGRYGQINAKGGTETQLQFRLLDDAMGKPVLVPRFLLTLWDITAGLNGEGGMHIQVGPVQGYYTTPDHALQVKELSDRFFLFAATNARKEDTPFNPEHVDESMLRRAVTVEFKNISTFRIHFQVGQGVRSRNLVIGGESLVGRDGEALPSTISPVNNSTAEELRAMHAPRSDCLDYLRLNFSRLVQNNLGGAGPDSGEWNMRFDSVAEYNESQVDMIVTADGAYKPNRAPRSNGNDTAALYFEDENDVMLHFVFVKQGQDIFSERIPLSGFHFTLVNMDGDDRGARMHLHINEGMKYDSVLTEAHTEMSVEEKTQGKTIIRPKSNFRAIGNSFPAGIHMLTNEQRNRAVSFYMKDPTTDFSFQVKIAGAAGAAGHTLYFAGTSPLACGPTKSS